MFILCACNDEPWRAFVPCIPLQPFRSNFPVSLSFTCTRCILYAFALLPFCRFLARYLLPSNVFNVHFMQFLSGFKWVICVVRTFAPFALFRALK